jgi:TonB family protein
MRSRRLIALLLPLPIYCVGANRIPASKLLDQMIHRSTLAQTGAKPFYLKATITDKNDPKSEFNGTVEEYWLSPTKFRRTIKLRDFSQTHIVNGDSIYEDNTGDYLPYFDEMLANEIVDPLPKESVDFVSQLGLMGAEPGSGMGQCMAEKYFNDADGQEKRVLLAYDCKTGLLIYLESPTCCYGVMTDYRKFHDKMIAYATKDDQVNIKVESLRDLDAPDESLFAISTPTPPAQRMITETVLESQARALIAEKSEIQWPTGTKSKEKAMRVDILIGRDGKVKDAKTYSPVDNATEDAALAAIRKWKFQPQSVAGVPAQIETDLLIPFPPEFLSKDPSQPEVRPIFDGMRAVNDLRVDGAPAFHLKASFHSEDGHTQGTYEETWISPKRWRREVHVNDTSILEVNTGDAFYRVFPGKYAAKFADDVVGSISFNLPGDNGADLHDSDWSTANTNFGNVPMLRLANGYINPQGNPDPVAVVYYIDEKTKCIRGRYRYSTVTVFNDLQPFTGKTVARKLTLLGTSAGKVEITIDALGAATNVDDSLFTVPGAKPLYTAAEQDQKFTQPRLIHREELSILGFRGKLSCDVKVDEHGHVRDVEVAGITDQSVIKSVRASIMSWEYEPATINGHPSLGFTHVNVE